METREECEKEYTVSHLKFDITAHRPIRIWSLRFSQPEYKVLLYGIDSDHPGLPWGPYQELTSKWDHIGMHDHDYCEIALIRGGTAVHTTPAASALVQSGDVIVASRGHLHNLEKLDGLEETHVAFLTEWLTEDLMASWSEPGLVPLFLGTSLFERPINPSAVQFGLSHDEWIAVDNELAAINTELARRNPSHIYLKVCLFKCLIILSRAFTAQMPEAAAKPFRREVWTVMERIEECVRNGVPFHPSIMAGLVDLSLRQFDTIFKEATGTTPTDYFLRRRVSWAARKLLMRQKSITEVAMECGYTDAAHFSNHFRRFYGVSPRSYRQLYGAQGSKDLPGQTL